MDIDTRKYMHFISDRDEYDLSAYSMVEAASPNSPAMNVQLLSNTNGVNALATYVDDVIVTHNEP